MMMSTRNNPAGVPVMLRQRTVQGVRAFYEFYAQEFSGAIK